MCEKVCTCIAVSLFLFIIAVFTHPMCSTLGTHTPADLEVLQSRVCGIGHARTADCDFNCHSDAVYICSLHRVKDSINLRLLEQLPGEIFFARAADYDEAGMRATVKSDQPHTHMDRTALSHCLSALHLAEE